MRSQQQCRWRDWRTLSINNASFLGNLEKLDGTIAAGTD
jgi:hypothetical protein